MSQCESLVYWYSNLEKHHCGYCKNKKGSISHGMWAKTLKVEDYQNLIDRGWRRSGNYCYKPLMNEICCPAYTIKCAALNFQISKSQKRVIKKFNKFLHDGELNKTGANQPLNENCEGVADFLYREAPKRILEQEIEEIEKPDVPDGFTNPKVEKPENEVLPGTSQLEPETKEKTKVQPKDGQGADPAKPPCKKAKFLRIEKKKEKLLKRGMSLDKIPLKNEQKTLLDFLKEAPNNEKHKLKLELINPGSSSKRWNELQNVEFDLYRKYQTIVHNDPPEKCKLENFLRFLVHSPLEITLERLHKGHQYFNLCAELFAKYQIAIHNDPPAECDEDMFINFLIESPLQHVKFENDPDLGFGSFHQLYWLDDKLIAVGVIDILPKCVSAVYFFYDPDYRDLTLGTYGSLRELEFTINLHAKIPSIEFYYMGYYIHSCPKMRYKGKLTPSYLLCPETYYWIPIEKCIPKLDVSKYSRLEENEVLTDEDACSSCDIDQIRILINRRLAQFRHYKRFCGDSEVFNTIGQLVGKKCVSSLIFIE